MDYSQEYEMPFPLVELLPSVASAGDAEITDGRARQTQMTGK